MKESASIAVIRGATLGASLRMRSIISSVRTWVWISRVRGPVMCNSFATAVLVARGAGLVGEIGCQRAAVRHPIPHLRSAVIAGLPPADARRDRRRVLAA